jgi:hypothetical protein
MSPAVFTTLVVATVVLLGGGAAILAVPPLWRFVRQFRRTSTVTPVADEVVSSDKPAPEGIEAYLQTVETASPSATPEQRWAYAKQGMTEAQVLRAEVKRGVKP